jgi:Ca2+-binding RTX toxin-like protein
MTLFLNFLSYKWCDTSGNWHSGYPDSSCHYTQIHGCNAWGQWTDCTPAPKLDGIVEGTTGNDVIDYNYTGDPEGDKIDHNDELACKTNNDLVYAYGGNDTVAAGEGHDKVYGGDGNDSLAGQNGNDTLYGDAGNDTLSGGADCNALDGGAGDDKFIGGAGSDTFTGGAGQDNLDYSASASGVTVNLSTGVLSGGDAANDHIASGIDGVIGSNSADSLTGFDGQGTSAADTYTNQFWGNGGNDTITGAGGNDQLYGGNDADKVYGGSGDDVVAGDAGADVLEAGDGNDTVSGGTGDDVMTGGAGADNMTGGDDRDLFIGGGNGDFVDGSEGGNDNDTLDLRGLGALTIAYDPANPENGVVTFRDGAGNPTGTLTFKNIESILKDDNRDGYVDGTASGDLIGPGYTDANGDKIDANDALLPGTAGNDDVVRAGDGNDTVLAGEGNDTVFGGNGNDSASGGNGNDSLLGEGGNDTLKGDAGDDRFAGGDGNDSLDGGDGNDYMRGDLGNDTMSGGLGNDDLYGDDGDDSLTGGDGGDFMLGGRGADTINGDAGNDAIYGGFDNDSMSGGAGNDFLQAEDGNDTVYGGDGRDTVVGGDGNDVIDTTSGNLADNRPDQGYPGLYPADTDVNNDRDSVDAGNGDDVIKTGDDADTISAGAGNDTVDAGVDNDVVTAGDGNDNVVGGEGSDTIDAGNGNDVVYGGFGPGVPDSVNIPDATDALPNNGRDSINAGEGNDTVYGMDDKDTIDGGTGNDMLDGGIDDDSITGAAGDDKMIGGDGADTLSGGDDKDLFVSGTKGDVVDGGEGGVDQDTLDLSGAGPLKIIYDPANPENGTVQFLDPTDRHVTGTMTFKNIENVIPCFTPGTLIATPRGEVPVETLRAGDRIITRDNGMQEIRWVGRRDMSWADLAAAPHLKPILIKQGSLGNGLPERDMMVSPNHRVLVANDRTALYFDEHEVLVAAKHLAGGKGVHSVDAAGASYIHFMFDRHEVVLSNGAWTESFQPGDLTLKGMGNAQRTEIFDLFPELKTEAGVESYGAARRTLKRHEAMLIAK